MKLNQLAGAKEVSAGEESKSSTKSAKATTGTQFLIEQFPYDSLSDLDLVKLYDISGFKLGDTLDDSIQIVKSLRSLSKPRFVTVLSECHQQGQIPASLVLQELNTCSAVDINDTPESNQIGALNISNG